MIRSNPLALNGRAASRFATKKAQRWFRSVVKNDLCQNWPQNSARIRNMVDVKLISSTSSKERTMKNENLESVARKLVAAGKGILAADESSPTIEKRLKNIDVVSTEDSRRAYREVLFTTAGAGEFISGVILFDETIRQKTRDGRSFVAALEQQGIIPGIKVDKGAKPMANFPGEKVTEGLDGLRERLAEYRKLGARFAKWRAVITIGEKIPTRTCINANAEA